MDLQSLLCGLNPLRSRKSTKTKKKVIKAKRKHLPLPTGDYTVGSLDIITDYGKEGLFLRLYYPTNSTDIVAHESQWPLWLPDKRYGLGYVYFRRCSTKIHGRLFNFLGADIYSPTLYGAAPFVGPAGHRGFPVLTFSHGLGGNRTTCSTLGAELASHGFIVVSIEHRDGTASMTYYLKDPVNNNNQGEEADQGDGDADDAATAAAAAGTQSSDPDRKEVKVICEVNDAVHATDAGVGDTKRDATTSVANGSEVKYANVEGNNATRSRSKKKESGNDIVKVADSKVNASKKAKRSRAKKEVEWLWYERQENEEDFEVRNKQVKLRTTELQRALDLLEKINAGEDIPNLLTPDYDLRQFKGKMDLERIVSTGHSFGATAAVALAGLDDRIKCCLAFDVWMIPTEPYMYENLQHKPMLLLNTEKFGWYDNHKLMVDALQPNQDTTQTTMLTIRGTCHQSFSDFQFLVPKAMGKHLWLVDELKPVQAVEIISKASTGFLNKHLDIPGPLHEDIMSAQHELIMKGTNIDLSTPSARNR